MAITKKNAADCLASIAEKKAKGYLPSTFEILLDVATGYTGIVTGYKDVEYTNAKGKGLIIFVCADIEFNGKVENVDIPITESKVGMWNEGETVTFDVTKEESKPKRVKLSTTESSVNVAAKGETPEAELARLETEVKSLKGDAKKAMKKRIEELEEMLENA